MVIYDVVIIGAGIVGTSIARQLSRYKLKVAILEKEAEPAFGVSKSNSGIIHPGTQTPAHTLKAHLCVQGNILTRQIAEELGVDFKETGELIVAFTLEEAARLRELKNEARSIAVPRIELVDKAWLAAREPNLSPEIIAALYAPTAGIISPYRWAYDLSENAIKNGAEIFTQVKVESITPCGRGPSSLFELSTATGEYKARYVINAGGLFADEVSRMVGIDNFRITPRKGEEFLLDKKRENLTNHLIFPLPSKTSKGVIMIKTSDGNPMIGPTAEDVDDKFDLSTSQAGLKGVFSQARKMVPSVDENDIIAYFAGLRPVAGEDFIIRAEDKVPGFINVAGIQSPGLTAAPAIAVYVSGLLKQNGLGLRRKLFFHSRRKKEVHIFSTSLSQAKKLIRSDKGYGDIVCRCEMVSAREIEDAIDRGAQSLDGIKFRTRAQAGRCHGSFCTTRILKMLAKEKNIPLTAVTKRGRGSEVVHKDRSNG